MSKKLKNILAENMRRFNTKNLSEQDENEEYWAEWDMDDDEDDVEFKQPSLDPTQKQRYAKALVARFFYILADEDGDWEAAVQDSAWSSPAIVANLLCGDDPLDNQHGSLDSEWDTEPNYSADESHPYYKLKSEGYNSNDVVKYARTLYQELMNSSTTDKKLQTMQKWVEAY